MLVDRVILRFLEQEEGRPAEAGVWAGQITGTATGMATNWCESDILVSISIATTG